MRKRYSLTAAGAILALGAAPASAQVFCEAIGSQPCNLDHLVEAGVTPLVVLSRNSTSTQITVTAGVYSEGFALSQGPILTVDSNTNWVLSFHAASEFWSGPYAKPGSDLLYSVDAGQTYAPFSTTTFPVANGAPVSGDEYDVRFRSLWSWENDPPGSYEITAVFTVHSP